MTDTNLIRFTQPPIRCPSPPGEEGAVVDLILREMRALGFDAVPGAMMSATPSA